MVERRPVLDFITHLVLIVGIAVLLDDREKKKQVAKARDAVRRIG